MPYLSFALLAPTWLVLVWLYWSFPKGAFSRWRRFYDVVVIGMTLGACIFIGMHVETSAMTSAADGFGRPSGQIWRQVKPALYGYGVATALLALGMLARGIFWRRARHRQRGLE
jgi:hypothetical protein